MSSKKNKNQSNAAPKPVLPDNTSSSGKAVTNSNTSATDFFEGLGNKAWLVSLGLIIVIALIVFKDYLTFDKVYLFKDIGSDTLNGIYPLRYYTANQIANHHFPQWSFDWGLGQNVFSFVFRDPFDVFLFLMGKNHVVYGIAYMEVVKILLSGMVFFFYLKTINFSNYTSVLGSLLFAFCAFMIVGGGWSFFSSEAFAASLLLLSFELLFIKKNWLLFPIAICIIGISTPVNLYTYGLFIALYAILRFFQVGLDLKGAVNVILKMIGLGLLGILVCAPFLIENILTTLESPRGNGTSSYSHILSSAPMFNFSDKLNLGTCVMRFFSSDILGSGNDFKGWQNIMEAPMFYCGIPCLLLLPQVFQFLEKRARIAFIVFASIWILPIIFPYFRYAFWLFTGDYYRAYSFFVSLVFIYYSLQALELITQKKKISLITLIITVVILFALLNYPFFPDKDYVSSAILTFVSLLLLVYGGLLYFMSKQTSPVYLKYIFMGVVVFELIYFSSISVNQRDAVTSVELSQKVGYNDYTVDAIKYIKSIDNSFYRVDKNYASSGAMHYSLNDGLVQGYRGTSSYNSFNQGNYINYLGLMGALDMKEETQTRWAMGLINKPILESENRVKYILAKKNINPLWLSLCDSLGTFGDVRVFKSKFVLPLGFTYSQYIRESAFSTLSLMQKDFVSLRAFVVNDKDVNKVAALTEFQLKDTVAASAFSFDLFRQYANELSKDSLKISRFDEHEIAGNIDLQADKIVYLSIPFDNGWNLKVNGQPADKIKIDGGLTGIMLKKGNSEINMTYKQRYLGAGFTMALAGLLFYIGLMVYDRRSKVIS